MWLDHPWGHLLARSIQCIKFRNFQANGSRDIEWTTFSHKSFDLDLWPCDLTIKGVIYLLEASSVSSLDTFKQTGQEILNGQHLLIDQQFDRNLWPCDLKINQGHLLPRGIHCSKSANSQPKGSKDIERSSLSLQTNRSTERCKTICPLFPKGCIKITSNIKNGHTIDYILKLYIYLTKGYDRNLSSIWNLKIISNRSHIPS